MKDIGQLLEQTGYPVAEGHFLEPQTTPFIVYFTESQQQRGSDNINRLVQTDYRVELYTDTINPDAERVLDDALSQFELQKDTVDLEDERMHEVIYTFTTLDKIRRT